MFIEEGKRVVSNITLAFRNVVLRRIKNTKIYKKGQSNKKYLIANRAVEWMVYEKEFHDTFTSLS